MRVLVAGASGFVGQRLCVALGRAGHDVVAMTRDPAGYRGAGTPVRGDVQDPATLDAAMAGCGAAYYLVHSLQDADFEHKDATGATAFGEAAGRAGLRSIIYLSGLGSDAVRGWARVAQGDVEFGIGIMQEGLAAWRATGSKFHVPYRLARAAEAHLIAGRLEDGLRLADEASSESGDVWFMSELDRLRGELLFKAGDDDEAERCLNRALETARRQGARLLELRAAMSLARLLETRGGRSDTPSVLAPIFAQFTEGLDTADLKEASALLAEAT